MLGYQSPSVRLFANRFEPVDNAFIFRANRRSHGIRVSIAERDRLVAEFARRSRIATWLTTLALILLLAERTFPSAVTILALSDLWTVSMAGIFCVAFFAVLVRLWNAPSRALWARADASDRG